MDKMLVSDLSESSGNNERGLFVRKTGGEGTKGKKANDGNHKSHERFREQGRWVLDCRGLKKRAYVHERLEVCIVCVVVATSLRVIIRVQ